MQESWPNLVCQLPQSDLWKVYAHLSEEYLIRFGSVDDRKVVAHSEFAKSDLARLFRMAFQLSGNNLSVLNRPSTGPQLPLLKFEGLDTRSKRSYDLQKQMDDWDAKVGRALKSEAEQKQGLKRLKCRMRQSRSREKKSCACSSVLVIVFFGMGQTLPSNSCAQFLKELRERIQEFCMIFSFGCDIPQQVLFSTHYSSKD